MKKQILTIGAAMLFTLGSATFIGCGNSENNEEESHEHTEEHEHHEGEGVEGDHHEHEEHSHASGGHMVHMNEVRDWLKKELGDKYDDEVPPATTKQLETGKKTFTAICAACHGITGKGDGAAAAGLASKPADFTDPSHSAYYSDMGRIHIIKNGIKETPMTGWSAALNEDEILAVYAYVRSLRSSEGDDRDHKKDDGHDHEH